MNRRWVLRAIGLPLLLLIGVAYPQAQPEQAAAPPAQASQTSASAEQATLNRYCASCHNEKAKQGNFALSTLDVANVGPDAERWELVVRKLRARSMPPAGRPRPTEAAYDGLVAHLETSLDRVASANPDPGRTDTFRRLNRTEYQNAIRDLLALEVDVETLLPSDDSSHGFDNISVGGLSPMLLERYLSAAQKISRLAVGTPVRSAGAETIVLPPDLTQEDHFDGESFGTRAGTLVRYTFPADGEYQFELRLTRDRNELIEGLTEPHQMEVSVDGTRLQVFTLTPAPRSRTERQRRAAVRAGTGGRCAPELPDARHGRTARRAGGVHQAAVRARGDRAAAVSRQLQQRPDAENAARALQRVDCGAVQPERHRRYPESETYFLVPPVESGRRDRMRPDDYFYAGAPRVSASGDESRSGHPSRLLQAGARGRQLRAWHRDGAARDADEPGVPLPDRAGARRPRSYGGKPGLREGDRGQRPVPIASTISSWPRGCRFLSGAAFPTTSSSMRP